MEHRPTIAGNYNELVYVRKSGMLKKIAFLIVFFFCSLLTIKSVAQICCPDFKLQDAVTICPPEGACQGGSPAGGTHGASLVACKNTVHEYTVYPNLPAFSYVWTVTGGTPVNYTGNPINILWGSGSSGFIKVIISNLGSGGSCVDSIITEVCLIDGPNANFTVNPTTVCMNSPVHFTNTSSGGSTYLWDFGDGTNSNLANPPDHVYNTPGSYTVVLTATNANPATQGTDNRPPCGCSDSVHQVITVLNGAGPVINTDCCYGTVCPGDTSSFCTSVVCNTYNWVAAGGTIISGAGTNCIKVKWNSVYTVPTTISLSVPGCVSTPCPGTTTLNVPVLYPNLPINGPTILCVGASGSFFLPSMPGTYYLWTTTAAPGTYSFNEMNRNVANVNISFSVPGTYQVQCQYHNPLSGCSGTSVFTVNVLPVFSFIGDETVCEGSTTTYFANGTANWVVTPVGATVPVGSMTSASITWNIPGTFTITATPPVTGLFCNLNAVKVVQVIPKPVLGNIQGPVLVCPGKNLTYSISSNVQGSQYVWAITSGTGTILSQMGADQDSVILQLVAPGPWTISVYQQIEISPGVFCQSLTQSLVVNSYAPPVITGTTTVCVDAVNIYNVSGPTPPGGFQWSVTPPNRGSILLGQGTNTVTIRWHGTPIGATITASNCAGTGSLSVTILNPPSVAPISANGPTQYCFPTMPNNLTLSTTSGFVSYQWYLNNVLISGANSFSYLIPNATFTGQGIYYFSVDVSNGVCTTTQTTYILIGDCSGGGQPPNPVVCSIDFSINPNPVCQNQPVTFTAIPTGPGFTYQWDFGDGATSFQSTTEHTYILPGVYNVQLTATLGTCQAIKIKTITVNPTPGCTITASDTLFCPGSFVTLTSNCPGMSSYQWYYEGTPIPGATGITYNASKHGEYWVVVTNNFGCSDKSNAIYLYLHALPKAKITGDGLVCAFPGGFTQFPLTAFFNSAYVYDWSSNAAGVTFTPNNSNLSFSTLASLTLPGTLPVTYYFVVKVTDTVTGCEAMDTLCIAFYETPTVTINYYAGCEGGPVVLTPNAIDTVKYHYQWSHGQTTPSITVSAPGSYSLTVIDKSTGCATTVPAATIYPKPDLSLFPRGCRTIKCKTDTLQIYIPLPLNAIGPFSTYPSAYPVITWYDNGNYGTPLGTGQTYAFVAGNGGNHNISVVVQNHFGCSDTAGVFCLTVVCDTLDFGDAPDNPAGGYNYPTLLANNGARHVIVPGEFLGLKVDAEPNGQPSITANCDDNDCLYPSGGDDEDGVVMPTVIMIGATVNITVQASVNGYLDLWIDYNVDGDWADPGEHVFTTLPVIAGSNNLSFAVPTTATMGLSYARYRFRTNNIPISYNGLVNNGEVEDYPVFINDCAEGDQLDFGDAPDNPAGGFNYPTLLASNGARHIIFPNIRMGALIDAETDGQPNIQATGDDLATSNDEDGVGFIGTMYVGQPANLTVTASIPGFLNAWMDFNKDGDWADPGEQIFTNQPLTAGVNTLTFPIPLTAQPGKTYMRFRFNTIGGLTYSGLATDGEVEDYRVHSCPNWKPIQTPVRHLILVPNTLQDLHDGDVLGVFYHDNTGNLACGGLVEWSSTDNQVMVAYGDNPATPDIIEGFVVGEPFTWMICSRIKGDSYPVDVVYDVDYPNHNGLFAVNGLSALTKVIGLYVSASGVPANICTGESVQLTATVPAGSTEVTFSWTSSPPGFVSDLQNPVVFPEENTSYFVDAFDGAFHAFDSVKVMVTTVNPLGETLLLQDVTIPASQNKCYNATQTITVAGNGTTFTIDNGGNVQMVAGLSVSLLSGTKVQSGGYLHAYISSNGNYCCNIPQAPATKEVALQDKPPLGSNNKSPFFKVYPNPTSGAFTIELDDTSESTMVSVEIYGIMGEKIKKYEIPGFRQRVFDVSDKLPGIYLIKVMNGEEMGMTKIIKQ